MGFNSPQTQFSSRSRGMDRAPPHSISAISAHRSGGKKVPKKYRKYHKNHKKVKDSYPRRVTEQLNVPQGSRLQAEGPSLTKSGTLTVPWNPLRAQPNAKVRH
ncbi:hypothetical protein C7974DRAFT_409391 [Boeremia exigua]|uniref:uncharacterized protein n=1 Tax=Boeremia exigua TaxID=749465 RepID=UPI001E8D304C|nr:uncharacterized protein C7974DRAFT_409391 [Boeremia exigua]KAH6642877.1 hypothetical protein C7974DRAFT_409391 [Boeremia exigua]